MKQMEDQSQELADRSLLAGLNSDDSKELYTELREVVKSFILSVDKEGLWKKEDSDDPGQWPMPSDISRGLKMIIKGNNISMPLANIPHITREDSMKGKSNKKKSKKELRDSSPPVNSGDPAKETPNNTDDLIERQRMEALKELEDANSKTMALANSEQEAYMTDLQASFEIASEEVQRLKASYSKAKDSLKKAKNVAEKRGEEINNLRAHIRAIQDEMQRKDEEVITQQAEQQDRIIAQYNKRTEALVHKHQKSLMKEKKARDAINEKLANANDNYQQLQQQYDVKVMEYETLMRDYEQLKFENMRKVKELGGFGNMSSMGVAQSSDTEKLRQVVTASKPANPRGGASMYPNDSMVTRSAPNGFTSVDSGGFDNNLPQLQTASYSSQTTLPPAPPGNNSLFSRNFLDRQPRSDL